MSIRVLSKRLDSNFIANMQRNQYSEIITITDTVPANEEKLGKASIGNHGAFLCDKITGSFTTLKKHTDDKAIDNGVCYLAGQLMDQTGSRQLFNDYVPLNLILSPGRVKSAVAENNTGTYDTTVFIAGDASSLFYPFEFEYYFPNGSEILFRVKNSSDYANSYSLVLNGIRVVG